MTPIADDVAGIAAGMKRIEAERREAGFWRYLTGAMEEAMRNTIRSATPYRPALGPMPAQAYYAPMRGYLAPAPQDYPPGSDGDE